MTREDKFVKVCACGKSIENETYYSFTVYPGSERPRGCFDPVRIGEIRIQLNQQNEYEFTLVSGTEWAFDEKYHDQIGKNLKTVYLFTTSLNKCLKELLQYDIPELSFLAGKLQYKPAERIVVDLEQSISTTPSLNTISRFFLSILNGYYDTAGIPSLPQADYLLQIVDNPMAVHRRVSFTSIMPIIESPTKEMTFTVTSKEPFTHFKPIRDKLWWLVNLPEKMSDATFNKRIAKRSQGFIYRGGNLIYTFTLNSIEDVPFTLWSYLKEKYNILPKFYDEESFEVSRTLNSIKEGIAL